MIIEEIQQEITQEFTFFESWMDRYQYLIDLGKSLPVIDEDKKLDKNLIRGCQSRVWLHSELKDGRLFFTADSDAILTKGIVALLLRVFSGQEPQSILNADTDFIDKIGLKEHLSPTRANGLLSMIKQIKLDALAQQTKLSG